MPASCIIARFLISPHTHTHAFFMPSACKPRPVFDTCNHAYIQACIHDYTCKSAVSTLRCRLVASSALAARIRNVTANASKRLRALANDSRCTRAIGTLTLSATAATSCFSTCLVTCSAVRVPPSVMVSTTQDPGITLKVFEEGSLAVVSSQVTASTCELVCVCVNTLLGVSVCGACDCAPVCARTYARPHENMWREG